MHTGVENKIRTRGDKVEIKKKTSKKEKKFRKKLFKTNLKIKENLKDIEKEAIGKD